jgi:hypothetical protein
VQGQAIAFAYGNNSTRFQTITNSLFFLGLFLDILGACIAYVGVIQLNQVNEVVVWRASKVLAINEIFDRDNGRGSSDPNRLLRCFANFWKRCSCTPWTIFVLGPNFMVLGRCSGWG